MRPHCTLPTQPLRAPEAETDCLPDVWVEIVRGRARRPFRPVAGRVFLLGRAADCDIVLSDLHFPESYAYLLRSDVGVNIRWLGDGPELRLNQRRVGDSAAVHDGDLVRLGNHYELRLHISWPAPEVGDVADETWHHQGSGQPVILRADPLHALRRGHP